MHSECNAIDQGTMERSRIIRDAHRALFFVCRVCVVCVSAAYLTLDLTLLIEGQEDDELPEVILGGCRLRRVDLSLPEVRPTPTE